MLITRRVGVEGFGPIDDDGGQLGMQLFKDSFAEAGADVADCFVRVGCGVVAGQEKSAVNRSAFAFAVISA